MVDRLRRNGKDLFTVLMASLRDDGTIQLTYVDDFISGRQAFNTVIDLNRDAASLTFYQIQYTPGIDTYTHF